MSETIAPHGGRLVNRLASAGEAAEWQGRLGALPSVRLNNRQISDLEMIATGGLSPLTGFMGEAEYRGVVQYYQLAYNVHCFARLKWVMERSLTTTLAGKHRTRVSKIYKR